MKAGTIRFAVVALASTWQKGIAESPYLYLSIYKARLTVYEVGILSREKRHNLIKYTTTL